MNSIKSLIYTVIGVIIFIAVVKFFIFLLPFFIIAGLIIYLISIIKRYINKRNKNSAYTTYEAYKEDNIYSDKINDSYQENVVDVDYEEVNK